MNKQIDRLDITDIKDQLTDEQLAFLIDKAVMIGEKEDSFAYVIPCEYIIDNEYVGTIEPEYVVIEVYKDQSASYALH